MTPVYFEPHGFILRETAVYEVWYVLHVLVCAFWWAWECVRDYSPTHSPTHFTSLCVNIHTAYTSISLRLIPCFKCTGVPSLEGRRVCSIVVLNTFSYPPHIVVCKHTVLHIQLSPCGWTPEVWNMLGTSLIKYHFIKLWISLVCVVQLYYNAKCRRHKIDLVNQINLVYKLFLVYSSVSTCFRRLCAHHQEKKLYLCDTWYLLFCLDDWYAAWLPDIHLLFFLNLLAPEFYI
jgi:hypothetical protein